MFCVSYFGVICCKALRGAERALQTLCIISVIIIIIVSISVYLSAAYLSLSIYPSVGRRMGVVEVLTVVRSSFDHVHSTAEFRSESKTLVYNEKSEPVWPRGKVLGW